MDDTFVPLKLEKSKSTDPILLSAIASGLELKAKVDEQADEITRLKLVVQQLTSKLREIRLPEPSQEPDFEEAFQGSPSQRMKRIAAELQKQMCNAEANLELRCQVNALKNELEVEREQQLRLALEIEYLKKQIELERKKTEDSRILTDDLRSRIESLKTQMLIKEAQISVLTLQVEELEKKPVCKVTVISDCFEVIGATKKSVGSQCFLELEMSKFDIFMKLPETGECSSQTEVDLGIFFSEISITPAKKSQVKDRLFEKPRLDLAATSQTNSTKSSDPGTPISRKPTRNFETRKAPMLEFFILTAQSVKLNSENKDLLFDAPVETLYSNAVKENIPFYKWHDWILQQFSGIMLRRSTTTAFKS